MNSLDLDPTQLIESGKTFELFELESGQPARFRCSEVVQRNWSRIGIATSLDTQPARPLFLKQFVDRRGLAHNDQFQDEFAAIAKAQSLFSDLATIPAPTHHNPSIQLIGLHYYPMTTLDVVLRGGASADTCDRAFEFVLEAAFRFLETLKAAEDNTEAIRPAPVFRGFDVRNIGIPGEGESLNWNHAPYLFDLGIYRAGTHQEAAARILISVGLLNWGQPLARFIKGPDVGYWQQSVARLRPYLSQVTLIERLSQEYAHRVRDVQGKNWLHRQLKRAGLMTVGQGYIAQLRRLISEIDQPA